MDKTSDPLQWLYPLTRSAWSFLTPWESRRDRKVASSEAVIAANRLTLHQQMCQEGMERLCPGKYWLFCRLQPQTTGAVILMCLCTSNAVRIPLLYSPQGGCRLVSSCRNTHQPLQVRPQPHPTYYHALASRQSQLLWEKYNTEISM